ncbi:alpha-L-fucosidase-like [Littorina saxatilis]|uniref:alpha-L-fucosidase n=1 Tax=Littorina saxatilis TaxID=31220 RepID=A0AAN9APE9_9CAEN
MMIPMSIKVCVALMSLIACADSVHYQPTWESLDSRPLPAWYDQSKIGIFIHWGVFSVPSYGSEWFWWYWQGSKPYPNYAQFVRDNYKPDWTYADFARDFTAEFYNPDQWAEIFKASGARYVVQVTKHHEGFTSWPSKYSWNWNAGSVGPHRDLVGELATAIRKKTSLHYGVYHSLFEWFNPLYLQDKANNFKTQEFVTTKTMPELYELVNRYEPDLIWSDGPMGAPDTYWQSKEFLTWLYNDSPVKDKVVVNDRWGNNTICRHGGFLTCTDRYNPKTLQKRKFEDALTIYGSSWGFVRNAQLSGYLPVETLITAIIQTVSCGGNVLINVGPTKEGTITPIYEERLRQMGSWLKVNGDAIYGTKPWRKQNDTTNSDVWYTTRSDAPHVVYAMSLKWPKGQLVLGAPMVNSQTSVTLLGYDKPFNWTAPASVGMVIDVPSLSVNDIPCLWAWVFELRNVF